VRVPGNSAKYLIALIGEPDSLFKIREPYLMHLTGNKKIKHPAYNFLTKKEIEDIVALLACKNGC
jgi:hypothetical protein